MTKNLYNVITIIYTVLFLYSCGSDCKFESITTDKLEDAKLNTSYSAKIEQSSTCSYTAKKCEIIQGELPKGLSFIGDGSITGTPEVIGMFTFTVRYEVCFGTSAYGATNCTQKDKQFTLYVKN